MVQTERTLSRVEIDERARAARLVAERSAHDAEPATAAQEAPHLGKRQLLRVLRVFVVSGEWAPLSRPGRRRC
jgi:hypothetical protein